jgi:hypothetical protein
LLPKTKSERTTRVVGFRHTGGKLSSRSVPHGRSRSSTRRHGLEQDGSIRKHYYVKESVGIAAGMFVAALHHMGLATLTHTPSPMAFLRRVMNRPENERAFCLFPVGFPADDCQVPDLRRKPLEDVMVEVSEA